MSFLTRRELSAPQEDRNFVDVYFIILGLVPVEPFHVEGMAKDNGDVVLGTEVGQPTPRENTFDADDPFLAIWGKGFQERSGPAFMFLCNTISSLLIENAVIHRTSMQVDATVQSVLGSGISQWNP